MTDWPTEWAYMTLVDTSVEPTQYAVNVLNAWQQSTPLQPWTMNPLGVPAALAKLPAIEHTLYGYFPTFQAFRTWFAKWLTTPRGDGLATVLNTSGSYGQAWRAINGLKWPAAGTETDWPSALLDLVEQPYRDSLQTLPANQRKTSGPIAPVTDQAALVLAQTRAMTKSAAAHGNGLDAIRDLRGRTS